MKVLIIGLGSIAQKHIRALRELTEELEIYALRSSPDASRISGVKDLFDQVSIPSDITFTIISNPTSLHHQTLRDALHLKKPVFLEKPPFVSLNGAQELIDLARQNNIPVYTAFNLRFHPLIQWGKEHIDPAEVLEVQAYCGSYLPDWRPQADYRKGYSAKTKMGGGVHLDLIHELDYLRYLFGMPQSVHRFFRKVSSLEIDSVDSAHYRLDYKGFGASVLLNYFRKDPKRILEVVTRQETIHLDLLEYTATNGQGKVLFSVTPDLQGSYMSQMKYFLEHLHKEVPMMNTLEEAVETLKICIGPYER